MYEELVKQLRELPYLLFVQLHGHEDVVYKAADAIEELSVIAENMNIAGRLVAQKPPKEE